MNNKEYLTTATSALTAMLNKIAGLVIASESDDPEYYDSMSCTSMMLANGIKMLNTNNPVIIHDMPEMDCDGDCEYCDEYDD